MNSAASGPSATWPALYDDANLATAVASAAPRPGVGPRTAPDSRLARRNAGDFVNWLSAGSLLENLKVLVPGFVTKTPAGDLEAFLVMLPGQPALDAARFVQADGVEALADLIPSKPLRGAVRQAADAFHGQSAAFFLESTLDYGYFMELVARLEALADEDRLGAWEPTLQEIDLFHLMLVTRGKFQYGLKPDLLVGFHVRGTRLGGTLRGDAGGRRRAERGGPRRGRVIDGLPQGDVNAALLEVLAWHRYLRLAQSAIVRSPLALGTVMAYAGIRRVELANLVTLSEGIRWAWSRRRSGGGCCRGPTSAWLKAGQESPLV